jgi:hypothetical protein
MQELQRTMRDYAGKKKRFFEREKDLEQRLRQMEQRFKELEKKLQGKKEMATRTVS